MDLVVMNPFSGCVALLSFHLDVRGLPVGNDLVLALFRVVSRFCQRLATGSNGPNARVVEGLFPIGCTQQFRRIRQEN